MTTTKVYRALLGNMKGETRWSDPYWSMRALYEAEVLTNWTWTRPTYVIKVEVAELDLRWKEKQ